MKQRIQQLSAAVSLIVIALLGLSGCASAPTPVPAPAASPTPASTSVPVSTPTNVPAMVVTPVQETAVKMSHDPKLGDILTDTQGMTLYLYQKDGVGSSNCTGDCAKQYPPLTVPQGVAVLAAQGIVGNVGALERTDGTYQVLYNDAPLYRYSGDKKPGDTNGIANDWSVAVAPPATSGSATPAAKVTDWTTHSFSSVLGSQQITNGDPATLTFGPYTIFVPQGTFTDTVKFDVLSGTPATFASKVPGDQMPVLAFAFDVRDVKTNQLVGKFAKPVTLTAKDDHIAADSQYYNVGAIGDLSLNMTGAQVQAGALTHPIAGAVFGWVITAPKPASNAGN
jgi:predicted lipoprotein with Yx(FWY)xxD motif